MRPPFSASPVLLARSVGPAELAPVVHPAREPESSAFIPGCSGRSAPGAGRARTPEKLADLARDGPNVRPPCLRRVLRRGDRGLGRERDAARDIRDAHDLRGEAT